MYYTYVLYSRKHDRIYIGQAADIGKRLAKHNRGGVKSTRPYVPWELAYVEEFETRSEAMQRERELKSHRGREFVRTLIRDNREGIPADSILSGPIAAYEQYYRAYLANSH